MLRLSTKIAYVGLAFRMGVAFASGDTFGESRSYVRTAAGRPGQDSFLMRVSSMPVVRGRITIPYSW